MCFVYKWVCFLAKCPRRHCDFDKRFQNVPAGRLMLKTDFKTNVFFCTNGSVFWTNVPAGNAVLTNGFKTSPQARTFPVGVSNCLTCTWRSGTHLPRFCQVPPDASSCCKMMPDAATDPGCCQMLPAQMLPDWQMFPSAARSCQMLSDASRSFQILPDAG